MQIFPLPTSFLLFPQWLYKNISSNFSSSGSLLVHSLPLKSSPRLSVTFLMLLSHMPALFMTSLTQTAGYAMARWCFDDFQALSKKNKKIKKSTGSMTPIDLFSPLRVWEGATVLSRIFIAYCLRVFHTLVTNGLLACPRFAVK